MTSKRIDLSNFDFSQFKTEAINKLKSGKDLTSKDGILTSLIKEIRFNSIKKVFYRS